jgi:hypothetical protein
MEKIMLREMLLRLPGNDCCMEKIMRREMLLRLPGNDCNIWE